MLLATCLSFLAACSPQPSQKLTGSGASFPAPLYLEWFKAYEQAHDVRIDYQAKGSGAGIKDFTNGIVDFAASDAAMTDEEIAEVDGEVKLLPLTAGKIVLAYNLPDGPVELKLSRAAYVKLFRGQVRKWNDPLIAESNPGTALPDLEVTVVVRSDSSGTTFVFTKHLSAISPEWDARPGWGKTVNWPRTDKFVAMPKNDGVTATIKQTPGAIGYIEYTFARQTGLNMASLENKAGNYIAPTIESGTAALAGVEFPVGDLRVWLPDPDGAGAYPIVTYTWLLCRQRYEDPQKAATIKDVVRYCLTEGQQISGTIGYVPLPVDVARTVLEAAETIE
jgi:phosphate transport system substrate-binding protein